MVKVTPNVVQCPPNHMTFAPAKFEIVTSNSLGEDAFTRKYIIWHWPSGQGHIRCCPVPSKSCDLCTYRVWSYYIKSFRRRSIYKKIQYSTFDSRSHEMLPSTLYIMWPIQLQSLKLLRLTVKEEIQLQENTLFWHLTLTFGSRSHEMLPSTLYIMWPIQLQSVKLLRLTV